MGNEFDIFKLQLYTVKMSYFCALLARTFEMLQEVENLTKNMNLTTRRCKKLLHLVVEMLRACSQCYSYESLQWEEINIIIFAESENNIECTHYVYLLMNLS